MASAVAALWSATVKAAAAGTLSRTISDGIALATWALGHPDEFAVLVGFARSLGYGADGIAAGGAAAVESPAMVNAGRPEKRGGR